MKNINKEMKNEDGSLEILSIDSNDNYELQLQPNYVLANHNKKKENKITKKFKNTILTSDIGAKSSGFSSIAILATVIALAAILVMYFMWRF